jgi:WD40 repeat protein
MSADGSLVATGGADQTIKVWNAMNGDLLYENKKVGVGVIRIKFASSGVLIGASTIDSVVKVYQIKQMQLKQVA